MKIARNLQTLVRCLLGLILVWAALSKLSNLQEFYGTLAAYRLPLPDSALCPAAETLPWLEFLCGLLLLARLWYRAALLWSLILCVIFLLATGQAWARGLQISCGCMNLDFLGSGARAGSVVMLLESVAFAFLRALVLLAAGWFLYCAESGRSWPGFRPRATS